MNSNNPTEPGPVKAGHLKLLSGRSRVDSLRSPVQQAKTSEKPTFIDEEYLQERSSTMKGAVYVKDS